MTSPRHHHCALVIGLSSHGLTIARSLRAAGIRVMALEDRPALPGFRTGAAEVITVSSLVSDSLFDDLHNLRAQLSPDSGVVLFPTNDTTVALLARGLNRLPPGFLLSWAESAATVLSLLSKSSIEAQSLACGLAYPRSFVAKDLKQAVAGAQALRSPYIAKPVTPQSGFKALRFNDTSALSKTLSQYPEEFPILVQEWIEGGASDLFFCAAYLQDGECITTFTGKKLESYPPALGQTTVAVSVDDEEVAAATRAFFKGTGLYGPASLELKRAPDGRLWVIEPTVGRSDFWLGLCTRAGLNLPLMEFQHALHGSMDGRVDGAVDGSLDSTAAATQGPWRPAIWFDSERDPAAPLRHLREYLRPGRARRQVHFSYLDRHDRAPFYPAARNTLLRAYQKLRRPSARPKAQNRNLQQFEVRSFSDLEQVPPAFLQLLQKGDQCYPFYSAEWLQNLCQRVAVKVGEVRFLCIQDRGGTPVAFVPLWLRPDAIRGLRLRKVSLLSNYYSPRMDLFINGLYLDAPGTVALIQQHLRDTGTRWHVLELSPLPYASARALRTGLFPAFMYPVTLNYFHALPADFATYLRSRPTRLRQTIKRRRRKLERAGKVQFEIKTGDSDLSAEIANYHNVYTSSWKIDEPYPGFINGLVALAAARGWLRLGTLALDGKVIASQIWLLVDGTAYIFKLAYDKDYSDYSPGTLLTAALLEHVIERDGATRLDFLLGKDAFKKDWMDSHFVVHGIQYPSIRSLRGLVVTLLNGASALVKTLRRAVSERQRQRATAGSEQA